MVERSSGLVSKHVWSVVGIEYRVGIPMTGGTELVEVVGGGNGETKKRRKRLITAKCG